MSRAVLAIAVATVACRDQELASGSQGEYGAKLFRRHCAACHGVDGEGGRVPSAGERIIARNLTDADFQAARSDEQLRSALKHGKYHMPAFGDLLNATQEKALVHHIRELGRAQGADPSAVLEQR